jgi:hypothetical protein
MKRLSTYETSRTPMGFYPGSDDAAGVGRVCLYSFEIL